MCPESYEPLYINDSIESLPPPSKVILFFILQKMASLRSLKEVAEPKVTPSSVGSKC